MPHVFYIDPSADCFGVLELYLIRNTQKEPFRKVGDSARNDYEKGMPTAHTLFQVKDLALIANARKVGVLLRRRSPTAAQDSAG